MIAYYAEGDEVALDGYAVKALGRVWKASRFSWYLTALMHRFTGATDFDRRMQLAELDYIAGATSAQKVIAENYVGLAL